VDYADDKRDWRGYAAWGSLLCGILGLVFSESFVAQLAKTLLAYQVSSYQLAFYSEC